MISSDIRTVSDDEVAHLRDHGWIKLDQLISPELTRTLWERAKARFGPRGVDHVRRPGIDLEEVEYIMNDCQPRSRPPMPRRLSVRKVTEDLFSGVGRV